MDFAQPIDDLKTLIVRILTAIENGGGEVNLRDLRARLIDLTLLIERDPGIVAAAEDLFAVATAMVKDRSFSSQPEARRRRLMSDARRRFDDRVAGARPLSSPRGTRAPILELPLAA
jgi:hypothetical protein